MVLHEAHHVLGEPEEVALQRVWIDTQRLGWTPAGVPALLRRRADQQSDGLE